MQGRRRQRAACRYAIRQKDGTWRVLLNRALADWPPAAARFAIAHELAHVAADSPLDETANALVLSWGLVEEMRAFKRTAKYLAARHPEVSIHPTAAMEAI